MTDQHFYIVGSGSFAVKLAAFLTQHKASVTFIDKQAGLAVFEQKTIAYENISLERLDGVFFIAISVSEYAEQAKIRLLSHNVQAYNIINMLSESAINVLEVMQSIEPQILHHLSDYNNGSFADLSATFFKCKNKYTCPQDSSNQQKNIGFFFVGKGGGFRAHTTNVRQQISEDFNIQLFSDTFPTANDNEPYSVMTEEQMRINTWPDIVINPHFIPCSPAHIPKITMLHMVYDFLVHRDLVAHAIEQADTHYLFIPSQASMAFHQKLIQDYKLANTVFLIPGGYPRLDKNIADYKAIEQRYPQPDCILYAPTLSAFVKTPETKHTYSILDAVDFIPLLLERFPDKKIIFRPHPDDLITVRRGIKTRRADAFRTLLHLCETHPRCELDSGTTNYIETFAKSAVMISDTSAIAFSFPLITGRHTIFFARDHKKIQRLLPDIQYLKDKEKIGTCVEDSASLIAAIENAFTHPIAPQKKQFCDKLVYHPGQASEYFHTCLNAINNNTVLPEWWSWNYSSPTA